MAAALRGGGASCKKKEELCGSSSGRAGIDAAADAEQKGREKNNQLLLWVVCVGCDVCSCVRVVRGLDAPLKKWGVFGGGRWLQCMCRVVWRRA